MLHIYLILAPHLLNSMSIPNSDSDSNDNNSGGSNNNDDAYRSTRLNYP